VVGFNDTNAFPLTTYTMLSRSANKDEHEHTTQQRRPRQSELGHVFTARRHVCWHHRSSFSHSVRKSLEYCNETTRLRSTSYPTTCAYITAQIRHRPPVLFWSRRHRRCYGTCHSHKACMFFPTKKNNTLHLLNTIKK